MRKRHSSPGRLLTGLICLALLTGLSGLAAAAQPAVSLGIYFTTNLQGRCYERDPLTGSTETLSYLKVATAIAEERAATSNTLLLDLGDALPTGLLASSDDTGIGAVAAALRAIGYDGFVPGGGELAYPTETRDAFFRTLTAASGTGKPVPVLSANYHTGQSGAFKADPYQVYTVQAGTQSFRVGVLALTAPEATVQAAKTQDESSLFQTWTSRWQAQLRTAEKCDLVVLAYTGPRQELSDFIAGTTGIDLVLSSDGSGQSLLNADQKVVPCATGSEPALVKTVVTFAPDGTFAISPGQILPLSGYQNDAALTAQLRPAGDRAAAAALSPLGTLSGDWRDSVGYGVIHSTAADLVGSAMIWASNADVALVSGTLMGDLQPASLFSTGAKTAPITLRNCYALYPGAGSDLCMVELTGAQVKLLLEQGATYTVNQDTATASGHTADLLYGADYKLYLGNRPTEQVVALTLRGTAVQDSQPLRVAIEYNRLLESPLLPDEYRLLWRAADSQSWSATGGSVSAVLAGYLTYQSGQVGYISPPVQSARYVYSGNSLSPVTRLEFISMLYELAGSPKPTSSTAFIDITDNNAVVWAAENRISSGDGKGSFLPAQPVTREQAAVMLYNYAKVLGLKTAVTSTASDLLDYGQISVWARPAVDFCYRSGAMPGGGLRNDLFFPQQELTRESAGAAVLRFGTIMNAK